MFTKILVGYDQSAHARAALTEAVDIARTQNATLTVLAAYSTFLAWPGVGLGALSQSIYDDLVTAATRLVEAPAAEAILAEVSEGCYDLIVLGSRGRGDVGSMFLGSVSHRVLHSSRIPVLVVTARTDAG